MSDAGSVGQADEQQAEQRLRDYILSQHQSRLESNGIVTGKDICQILESLGLPFEEGEVKPLLPDWNSVAQDVAVEAVTTVRITHNAELEHMLQRMEEGIIRLSLFEYIKYKMPFTKKDPSWQHRTIEFTLDLAPRQVLFISTGVVLLVAGMSILLLMSLLWLSQARGREEVQMENFHLLLHSFAESFEQRFLDVHAATMVDEADTLAKLIEYQQSLTQQDLHVEFEEEASLLAGVADVASASARDAIVDPQVSLMGTLRQSLFPADPAADQATLAELIAVVNSLNADAATDSDAPWETIVTLHDAATGAFSSIAVEAGILDCAYGPCDYASIPCVAMSTGASPNAATSVQVLNETQDVRRESVVAVFTRFDSVTSGGGPMHATVCSTLPAQHLRAGQLAGMSRAVAAVNEELRAPLAVRREVLLGHWDNASAAHVTWATPLLRIPGPCHLNRTCNGLDRMAQRVIINQAASTEAVEGYTGDHLLTAAAPTSLPDVAILLTLSVEGGLQQDRERIVNVVDRMNEKTGIELEVSIGRRDPETNAIIAQLTAFANKSVCIRGTCARTDASSVAAQTAVESRGAGYVISPNYQPIAVLAAYSFVAAGLDLSIVVERSIESIRSVAITSLVDIFNANNAAYSGSLEAQLVAFIGNVPTRTYDAYAACDYIRNCERDDVMGVLYRSDCVHCSRLPPAVADRRVQSLTRLKFQSECDAVRNCTREGLANSDGLWRKVLTEQNTELRLVKGFDDYRFERVLAVTSYVQNLSVGIVVKIDTSETEGPILERIGIASAVALVVVVVGLIVLIFFSRKVLDRIEHEWLTYKDQIDAEKKKFDAMVQDVLPTKVSEELHKTQKLAMSLPSMSFVFLDVVGMSDRTKSWSPELVCRYVTYIFTVVDRVSSHYSLNKVRVFGDTYFAVGGLGESNTEEHCVFRTACFGSVVVQLLGLRYAHFPDRVPLIRETFEDFVAKNGQVFPDVSDNATDVGHIQMPPMRVGMHYGIGTFCIIETGRTPAYEVFGPGVALAARMQSTSISNRIHMSGAMKEVLERLDKERLFDFDQMRKTVVKGQGTITSYFVRSASVTVPTEVLKSLGIEHANRRVYYEGEQAGGQPGTAA